MPSTIKIPTYVAMVLHFSVHSFQSVIALLLIVLRLLESRDNMDRSENVEFDVWHIRDPDTLVRLSIRYDQAVQVLERVLGISDISMLVGARSGLLLSDFGQFVDLDAFRERAAEKGNGPMDESTFNPGNWFLDLA